MNRTFRNHTVYLSLSIIAIYVWTHTPTLNIYNLQLTGGLILLYFAFRFITRSSSRKSFYLPSTIIMTMICLLLVFSTGGLISPLFFILTFLLFAIALLFEPIQAATASVLLVILFLIQNYSSLDITKIVNLVSLMLITPIAIIFSHSYLVALESTGKIKILKKAIEEAETDSLLWITTSAKPSLASVIDATTDLVMYFNSKGKNVGQVPGGLVEKLKTIQQDLITLYTSTNTLEKSIEDRSDNINV